MPRRTRCARRRTTFSESVAAAEHTARQQLSRQVGHSVGLDELPLSGAALLAAVSVSMVALHERYHHRKPVTVKTQLMGDELLACVMHGVYTEVEKR